MFLDDDGAVVEILQDDFGGAAADLRHRNRDRGKSRRQVFQETAVVPADYRQLLRHPHLTGGQHPQQLAGDPVVGADHQRKIPGAIPENPLHRFKGNLLGHKHFALFGDPGVLGGGPSPKGREQEVPVPANHQGSRGRWKGHSSPEWCRPNP